MKRCNLFAVVAVLFALSSPLAAHATAIGDTVQATYAFRSFSVTSEANAGDGVEFKSFYDYFDLDFSADQILVSVVRNTRFNAGVTLTFSDLTNAFTSASLGSSNLNTFTGDRVSLQSGGNINVNIAGIDYKPGDTFVINTSNVPSAVVTPAAVTPEPSSLMLLGTGLLGVVGAVRRRFARTV